MRCECPTLRACLPASRGIAARLPISEFGQKISKRSQETWLVSLRSPINVDFDISNALCVVVPARWIGRKERQGSQFLLNVSKYLHVTECAQMISVINGPEINDSAPD